MDEVDGAGLCRRHRDLLRHRQRQPAGHELLGADAYAQAKIRAHRCAHRLQDLQRKAHAVWHAAAVFIVALIRHGREKLLQQMPVAPVQFNAVHAGGHHVQSHPHMGIAHLVHALAVQRTRVGGAQRPAQITGRDGHRALKLAVDLPAHVADLRHQGSALGMHRLGHRSKGLDRAGQIARDALRPAQGVVHHPDGLEDDGAHTAAGAFAVVIHMALAGQVVLAEIGGVRRHKNPVAQAQAVERDGLEHIGVGGMAGQCLAHRCSRG